MRRVCICDSIFIHRAIVCSKRKISCVTCPLCYVDDENFTYFLHILRTKQKMSLYRLKLLLLNNGDVC